MKRLPNDPKFSVSRTKRTPCAAARLSAKGPGCVKTCTLGECAELFSLFSPFDGACQSGSFLIQRNRNKRSTRFVIETNVLRESSTSEFSHSLGQKRRFDRTPVTSVHPIIADMLGLRRQVRLVPDSEVVPHAKLTSKSGRAALLRSKSAQKSPAETRRLRLGLLGTGVVAANQPASVVRAAVVPTVAAAVLTVVHANRTVVGPDA
jgi:hypothetical protein